MSNKLFIFLLIVVLMVGFFIRFYLTRNNNFFFTVDQGNDAINVREILERKQLILKGPETSVRGVYIGPLWYYFIAFGYFIFDSHPYGAVLMVTILNLTASVFLMIWLSHKIGRTQALIIGFVLQFFWPFYLTSLWGFNPFPLVSLSLILVLFLTRIFEKSVANQKKKYYLYSMIPVFLAFNTNLAGAIALLLFYVAVGVGAVFKKLISLKFMLFALSPFPIIGIIALFGKFITRPLASGGGLGVFSGTNFSAMLLTFLEIVSLATIPQSVFVGVGVFGVVLFVFLRRSKKNFSRSFVILTLILLVTSFLFFASNRGWRDWHTVYLPPLLFVSFVLMLLSFPRYIGFILLTLVMVFQLTVFLQRYSFYLPARAGEPAQEGFPKDPGILANQLAVIDWIYNSSEHDGFNVYTYTNTFYDYQYQYLFWWYGKKTYGFMPCEYSNFPLSHKQLYVPGYLSYGKPNLGCSRLRFLIIESDTNGQANKDWIGKFRAYNDLVDQEFVGGVEIEKYYVKRDAPTDFCLWWGRCH